MAGQSRHRQPRTLLRQRGVAVVTALLLTTLAVTIVASLFWQQQVQVRSMENQRLQFQTRWIVRGALSLSRLILQTDFFSKGGLTIENGIWAQPLEETRIDDYIEREQRENENFNATLSGRIVDAQSRYNLTNLTTGNTVSQVDVAMFQRLLTVLQLDPALALPLARQVASSQPPAPPQAGAGTVTPPLQQQQQQQQGGEPMGLVRVDDLLTVSGFTQPAMERLRDFLIILPQRTELNLNTAAPELLAALSPSLPLADANVMVNARKRGGFYRTTTDYTGQSQLGAANRLPVQGLLFGVKSDFFLVYSRVRLDRAALDAVSLLQRDNAGQSKVLWIRENENGDQRKREF